MNVSLIDYERIGLWSHTDLAYLKHDPSLNPFLAYPPLQSSFQEVIQKRKKNTVDRGLLLDVLKRQYQQLDLALPFADEVLLNENTFTVTTAHQPTLLTGPLYHIYKIASTINLAIGLTESLPGQTVIPVFVVGGEDHDWEEINHLYLFGRKYQWVRSASGSCGRLTLEHLDTLIQTVSELFTNTPHGQDIKTMLEGALAKATNYGQFHQLIIQHLFGHHGLVILNMDDPGLKKAFVPVMEMELREQFSLQNVAATQAALETSGFKAQAYCRPVNLFYMSDMKRERIDPVPEGFIRVESGIKYTLDEIIAELHLHPDRFSPNVILRPLYQEYILPNLAYVGGGGEIAYWLERKSQFEAAGIHYPMLIRRNSLLLIDESTDAQITKADLTWEDLLDDYDTIVKSYLHKHSQADLSFTSELEMLKSAYEKLSSKAEKLDPTLSKAILAEESKQVKQFEQLGSRLLRAEKLLQDTNLKRIQKLKEKLFPENGLQERHENFLSIYAQYGSKWIADMIEICDPFREEFTVVQLQA